MDRANDLIIDESIKSPIVEAYKTLRTNIQFSMPDGGPQTVLITSSGLAEGKSTTTANLAITMAQSKKRVLLIDGDLRKPVIHRIFNIANLKGLTNILAENVNYRELIKNNIVDGLSIITSGPKPPNPSELLGSQRMRAFIELAKKEFDFIIIDTPPVLAVTDAIILSPAVDGVVLVVGHGQATFEEVARAKSLLERVDARLLGAILNQIPISQTEGYYYYYQEDHTSRARMENMKKAEA